MARARNIKPGFFKNEDLAECSPWARLCFAGLWTLADREGRLEDRPKRIKGELFAFDSIEVEPLLGELQQRGFILRYKDAAGRGLIQVLEFLKHQNPHHREPGSELASPQSLGLLINASQPKPEADDACQAGEASDKPEASPGLETPRDDLVGGSSRAESGTLIPDPGEKTSNLTVAPALPPEDRGDGPAAQLTLVDPPPPPPAPPKPYEPPDCPHMAVLALWAEELPALPQHKPDHWTGAREAHLRARWRETAVKKRWPDQDAGLRYFRRLFAHVGKSRFLTGQAPTQGDKRPFQVELEWLLLPSNWAKVHEGKYHAAEQAA